MNNIKVKLLIVILGGLLLSACSNIDEISGESSTPTSEELSEETQSENNSDLNSDEQPLADDNPVIEEEPEVLFSPTPSPLFEQNFGQNELSDRDYSDLEIITLLPPDAIPAFTFPDYYSVKEANQEYAPEEMVIGVEFNGDARAYSVSLLSRHEIVNDTVGGIHLAVTW